MVSDGICGIVNTDFLCVGLQLEGKKCVMENCTMYSLERKGSLGVIMVQPSHVLKETL